MRPPLSVGAPAVFVSHGDADAVLPVRCSRDRVVPALKALGLAPRYLEFAGPHAVPAAVADEALSRCHRARPQALSRPRSVSACAARAPPPPPLVPRPAPGAATGSMAWQAPHLRHAHRTLEVGAGREARETVPLTSDEPPSDDWEGRPAAAGGSADQVHDAPVDWRATGPCFLFPALGGLLFGFDIGASSGVLSSLTSETLSGVDWYQLSPFQSGLVISTSLLGALMGSLIALSAGNKLGRRTEMLAAAVLYGVCSAGMGVATSLNWLLACRTGYGLGIGLAMHAAPAYIAETSPPSVRGLLISLKEAIIVGGILAGYFVSYVFAEEVGGWRSIYACAAPLALLLFAGVATLPESPRWLLLSGASRDAAAAALVRAEGRRAADPALVAAELDGIAAAGASGSGGGIGELLGQERFRRPLLIGSSLMLFQQITGQPSVLYYAQQIFQRAGFASGAAAAEISVLLGAFKLAMTIVAVLTVDKLGRRPLLLAGVGGMVVALLALGLAQGGDGSAEGAAATVSVVALLLYVGCYQCSFGPISWLIVGEVFPLAVRSQAIALAAVLNYGSNFGVSLALPSVEAGIGLPATYLGFAAVGVVALASIYFTVPETKGKTLEEIEAMWSSGGPARLKGGDMDGL
ncbi:D-xylose-proton symporter-like chloroplastic [Raphidocelis subcapitata]|uniref:D-xylose-proton symporter-like chloroplastic n=1 Tax=Raphidocelis subcapitata TaxID=307507 RepID=A0A2V0PJ94_9CHLO|nr:D-xylose-proton symporter-like chloroplastic [Raphidocelis subcapitata]|eukprot:GBF98053.1 D-xylose-proton symporter-like chloroplastic [Raphidocelis subcapitata]